MSAGERWKATRQIERFDDSTLDRPYYSIELDTTKQPEGQRLTGYVARVDGMRGERQEANARLIAKAPEMAEELGRLISYVRVEANMLIRGNSPAVIAESLQRLSDKAERLLAEIEGVK